MIDPDANTIFVADFEQHRIVELEVGDETLRIIKSFLGSYDRDDKWDSIMSHYAELLKQGDDEFFKELEKDDD